MASPFPSWEELQSTISYQNATPDERRQGAIVWVDSLRDRIEKSVGGKLNDAQRREFNRMVTEQVPDLTIGEQVSEVAEQAKAAARVVSPVTALDDVIPSVKRGIDTVREQAAFLSEDAEGVLSAAERLDANKPTDAFIETVGAKTPAEAFDAFIEDPISILTSLGIEGFISSVPVLVSGILGSLKGGPIGAAAAGGTAAASVEGVARYMEEIQNSKLVDTRDPESLQDFFDRKTPAHVDLHNEALKKAAKKGGTIGAIEGALIGFSGVAGTAIGGIRRLRSAAQAAKTAQEALEAAKGASEVARSARRVAEANEALASAAEATRRATGKALAAEAGIDIAGGGAGEVAGTLAAGDELRAGSVFAEAAGGLGTQAVFEGRALGRDLGQANLRSDAARQTAEASREFATEATDAATAEASNRKAEQLTAEQALALQEEAAGAEREQIVGEGIDAERQLALQQEAEEVEANRAIASDFITAEQAIALQEEAAQQERIENTLDRFSVDVVSGLDQPVEFGNRREAMKLLGLDIPTGAPEITTPGLFTDPNSTPVLERLQEDLPPEVIARLDPADRLRLANDANALRDFVVEGNIPTAQPGRPEGQDPRRIREPFREIDVPEPSQKFDAQHQSVKNAVRRLVFGKGKSLERMNRGQLSRVAREVGVDPGRKFKKRIIREIRETQAFKEVQEEVSPTPTERPTIPLAETQLEDVPAPETATETPREQVAADAAAAAEVLGEEVATKAIINRAEQLGLSSTDLTPEQLSSPVELAKAVADYEYLTNDGADRTIPPPQDIPKLIARLDRPDELYNLADTLDPTPDNAGHIVAAFTKAKELEELQGISAIDRVLRKADERLEDPDVLGSGIPVEAGREERTPERSDIVGGAVESVNPEFERRIKKSHGRPVESRLQKAKKAWDKLKHAATRTFVHIPKNKFFAEALEAFRQFIDAPRNAAEQASQAITGVLDELGPKQLELFERKLLLDSQKVGLEANMPLRWGGTVESLQQDLDNVNRLVEATPEVQRALEARQEILGAVQTDLLNAGLITEAAAANKNYFKYQVAIEMAAQNAFGEGDRRLGSKKKATFSRRRSRGEHVAAEEYDPNSSYIEAEFAFLSEAFLSLRREQLLRRLRDKYEITNDLRQSAADLSAEGIPTNWQDEIPEGYVQWTPAPGGQFYRAFSLPEQVIAKFEDSILGEQGLSPEDAGTVLSTMRKNANIVIPQEIADQLDSYKAVETHIISKVLLSLQKHWKVYTLLQPKRFWGYNIRNLLGDLDPVLASNPGIAKETANHLGRLRDYYYGNKSLVPRDIREALERGVMDSSMTLQEIPDLHTLSDLKRFYPNKNKTLRDAPQAYFETVKKLSAYREATMRFAAYKWYLRQIEEGNSFNYGGASKEIVDGISDPRDKAAHLARNLLGDYGDITSMGNWLRTHLIPFWAFQEINIKRTPRLWKNAFDHSGKAGFARAAGGTALRAGVASTVATLNVAKMWALTQIINRVAWGEAEDELDEQTRSQPHLILGRDSGGRIIIFRNVGALGDFLEWFGANDLPQLMQNVEDDQMTTPQMLLQLGFAAGNKMSQGLNPFVKAPAEIAAGLSYFPDAFNPRSIERADALATNLGLQDELRLTKRFMAAVSDGAVGAGESVTPGYFKRVFGAGTIDPRQAALTEAYQLRNRFLEREGKGSRGTFGKSATSNMQRAVKNDDFEAFKIAQKQYLEAGGDRKSFKRSLEHIDPIDRRLNDKDEKKFEQEFLNSRQKRRLRVARDYSGMIRDKMEVWWKTKEGGQ